MAASKKNKLLKFRTAPTSEEEYQKLADEFAEWAKNPDALTLDEFPISIMMSPKIFHDLPANSEYFAKAYDIALTLIGSRRERLAQEGVLDKQIVLHTMPLYDPKYRKWLMNLRDKSENKGETKVVVVEIPKYM